MCLVSHQGRDGRIGNVAIRPQWQVRRSALAAQPFKTLCGSVQAHVCRDPLRPNTSFIINHLGNEAMRAM